MKKKKTKEQIESERFERIARRSYDAYKRNREKWIFKGYAMAEVMTEEKYKEVLKTAQETGISKNFARSMAADDRRVTFRQSIELNKIVKNSDVIKEKFGITNASSIRSSSKIHDIITELYSLELIDDREEFEKSLGY